MKTGFKKKLLGGERGFTIIELLVATAILVIIAGVLFSIFGKASDAWLSSEATVDRQRSARLTLDMMNRELSEALVTTGSQPNSTIKFFGTNTAVYFVAPVPPGGNYLSDLAEFGYRFVTNSAGNPISNIYRYSTYFNTDPLQSNAWLDIRSDGPPFFNGTSNAFANTFGSTNVLAENILDLEFYYYDTNDFTGTNTWNSSSSGILNQLGRLPSVIEVTALIMDSRKALRVPNVSTYPSAYTNYVLKYARTNSMAIHLFNAP